LLQERNKVQYLYKNPGYYNLIILQEAKTLDSLSVLVASKNFKINIAHDGQLDRFDESILSDDERFYIDPSFIKEQSININEYWSVFEHYKNYNCSGDYFTFESKIKNPLQEGAIIGQVIATKIKCKNGQIIIPLADSVGITEITIIVSIKIFRQIRKTTSIYF